MYLNQSRIAIRGARPNSARYDVDMTPEERKSITNGIWMCRTHARLIDADDKRYTVELLHKWKFEHEEKIRREIELSPLEKEERDFIVAEFNDESLAARQIALDKPTNWQYLLTRELLRTKFKFVQVRFSNLQKGFEYKPSRKIQNHQLADWWSEKLVDLKELIHTLASSSLQELTEVCCFPKELGDPKKIKWICNVIGYCCESLIEWARDIKYSILPDDFDEIKIQMINLTQDIFTEMEKIPREINQIISKDKAQGEYTIDLVFKLPENFPEISEQIYKKLKYHSN